MRTKVLCADWLAGDRQESDKMENITVPAAPWRKCFEHKPENSDTVIAVKRWKEDGKLHGGENCYIEGRGWCNFLGIPNASEPDMWMPMQDYLDYCKAYGTPIK